MAGPNVTFNWRFHCTVITILVVIIVITIVVITTVVVIIVITFVVIVITILVIIVFIRLFLAITNCLLLEVSIKVCYHDCLIPIPSSLS